MCFGLRMEEQKCLKSSLVHERCYYTGLPHAHSTFTNLTNSTFLALYSLTIPHMLRTKSHYTSNLHTLKGKSLLGVFWYFITSTCVKQKAKLTVNFLAFPLVKLRKIWQTGSSVFREINLTSFSAAVKDNFAKVKNNFQYKPSLLFSCLKVVFQQICCNVKILEHFTKGSHIKGEKCIYNSRLKAKILTKMIVTHYFIIVFERTGCKTQFQKKTFKT